MIDHRQITAAARAAVAEVMKTLPDEQAYEVRSMLNVLVEAADGEIGPAIRAARAAFALVLSRHAHEADRVKYAGQMFANLIESAAGTPLAKALAAARDAFIAAVQEA